MWGDYIRCFGRHERGWVVYSLSDILSGRRYVGMSKDIMHRLRSHGEKISNHKHRYYSEIFCREVGSIFELNLEILSRHEDKASCVKAEDVAIRTLRPEYNRSDNGAGITEKRRENNRHWGKVNSEKVRERGSPCRIPVKCLTTGEVFSSVKDAAKAVNGCATSIGDCCRGKIKHSSGMRFAFLHDVESGEQRIAKRVRNFSAIRCDTTGEVFRSALAASKKLSVDASTIVKHLNGKRGPVGGLVFSRVHP